MGHSEPLKDKAVEIFVSVHPSSLSSPILYSSSAARHDPTSSRPELHLYQVLSVYTYFTCVPASQTPTNSDADRELDCGGWILWKVIGKLVGRSHQQRGLKIKKKGRKRTKDREKKPRQWQSKWSGKMTMRIRNICLSINRCTTYYRTGFPSVPSQSSPEAIVISWKAFAILILKFEQCSPRLGEC